MGYLGAAGDDVWCLDSRGVLTLAVSKETYQRLGFQGEPLPWKGCDNTFGEQSSVKIIQAHIHFVCTYSGSYLSPCGKPATHSKRQTMASARHEGSRLNKIARRPERSLEHSIYPYQHRLLFSAFISFVCSETVHFDSKKYMPSHKRTRAPALNQFLVNWKISSFRRHLLKPSQTGHRRYLKSRIGKRTCALCLNGSAWLVWALKGAVYPCVLRFTR